MDAEKLTTTLCEKMKEEQDNYRAWLVSQSPEEILNHAHEYIVRQDILTALEKGGLTTPQAEALLESSSPLADLYEKWGKQETGYMDNIQKSIKGHADELIRRKEELFKSPLYKYPRDYAQENDELEQYKTSYEANVACMKAICKAISDHQELYSFDSEAAFKDVVGKFGYDRVLYVLAATLRNKEYDGRFSYANKNWARTIPVFEDINSLGYDRNRDYVVQSHPTLTDAFVSTARHEYLLSLPLTKDDIKAEALNILSKFQNAREPNSPNGTHYMAQISPDFLARAKSKDTDRLMSMLPFQSLSLSALEDRKGTFALISKDENRFQKLVLRRPSVRKKLQEQSDVPKPPVKGKVKNQER